MDRVTLQIALMAGRGEINCVECNELLPKTIDDDWIETDISRRYYGTHYHTCYGCLKHYCYICEIDGEDEYMLHNCNACKRDYCADCLEMTACHDCGHNNCDDCYEHACHKCNAKICLICCEDGIYTCAYCNCNMYYCEECSEVEENEIYSACGLCNAHCCNDCRLQRYRQGQQDCAECIKRIAPLLVDELQEENAQLKVDMEELKRENKELKLKIQEMRSRNLE